MVGQAENRLKGVHKDADRDLSREAFVGTARQPPQRASNRPAERPQDRGREVFGRGLGRPKRLGPTLMNSVGPMAGGTV